jgi:D-alanine--poly(phosphoribitol) ligase subunit 1
MTSFRSAANLGEIAHDALRRYSKQPALWVDGRMYTYAELEDLAWSIAAHALAGAGARRVAVLAARNEVAYGSILGAVLAGATYVPLNPRFSSARILDILQQSAADLLVCDKRCATMLDSISASLPAGLSVVVIESGNSGWLAGSSAVRTVPRCTRDDIAYIMFTSGTTGRPKGVPVSYGNALSFLANFSDRVPASSEARFLQLLDLSFDPSLQDLFGCWSAGATLYSAPEGMATMADRFVQEFQITHFTAVASTAALLQAQGRLVPGALSSLRQTIFGGETLPVGLAASWRKAAPGSTVRNHYGPTEATVAITECIWQDAWEPELVGSVPIGEVFDGQQVLLVDASLREVPSGTVGELLVSGTQVTRGYLNNPEATRQSFVLLPGAEGLWYRTGDLVERDPRYGLVYRGRVDQQLKVRGFRVEAQEVESHIRAASGSDLVAVVGWPKNEQGLITGLVAFAVAPNVPEAMILESCRGRMPDYMVPARVLTVEELPVNANGKVDYAALAIACGRMGS